MKAILHNFAPLLFINEQTDTLMLHAPPYGFKLRNFNMRAKLSAFRENASSWTPTKHNTCAVVGNSGILRLTNYGKRIDSHDAIFRVNHAPVAAFAQYVGTRTTFHVTSSHWKRELIAHPRRRFLVVCDRPFVYSCQNLLFAKRYQNIQLINPLFYRNVSNFAGHSKIPLTGFVAIFAALTLCTTVNTFGFTLVDLSRICQYYYEHPLQCKMTDKMYHARRGDSYFHDFAAHRKTVQWLNKTSIVNAYT
jgi:hypothetical protein